MAAMEIPCQNHLSALMMVSTKFIHDLFQLVAKLARFTEMMNLLRVSVHHIVTFFEVGTQSDFFFNFCAFLKSDFTAKVQKFSFK